MGRFNIAKSNKKPVKEFFEEIFEIFIESGHYTFSILMDNDETIIISNDNISEIIFSDDYMIIKYDYPAVTVISYDSISSIQGRQTELISKILAGEKIEKNRRRTDNNESSNKPGGNRPIFKWLKGN